MKNLFVYILFFSIVPLNAQYLTVSSGNLSIGNNTSLTLDATSLTSNGTISATDSSMVIITDHQGTRTINGMAEIQLDNLKIDANSKLLTSLNLSGDIVFSYGILDFENSDIRLGGKLLGESEENRAFSTGTGRIIKTVDLVNGKTINPGNLGLVIMPLANYKSAEFSRGHESQVNEDKTSIYRYYTLPAFNESTSVIFNYFEPELNGLDENDLKLWGENNDKKWQLVNSSEINSTDNNSVAVIDESYSKISLFETYNEITIKIPNGFSPNNDGVNDFFIIEGADRFPNNKLTVFNQWGDILYEESPYENNWGGENNRNQGAGKGLKLSDGTYFYIFFLDKNNSNTVRKGFIEIKSSDQ